MGYRSQVGVELNRHAAKVLGALCGHSEELKDLVQEGMGPPGREYNSLRFDHIKWYESYKEIELFDTFLNNLPEDSYHFIRLGEDFDDTETRGYFDSGMYINRSIESC